MNFLGSVLLLLSVCLFLTLPYAVGYGLALHKNMPIIVGLVGGALGVGLFLLQGKLSRQRPH
jgi:hypothetical protein